MINSIYVLVSRELKTFGHGDVGTADELARPVSWGEAAPYPAFASASGALEFRDSLGASGSQLIAVELELRP